MTAFRRKYFDLPSRFNPVHFDADTWVRTAQRAGMKYVVFTTKHHDGFCMFDSKLTDYRITHPSVPWSRDRRANVTRAVFDAFRGKGFGIGAYFSKPDWHCPWYWDPARWAEDRNPNYDVATEPDRWAKFVDFTHGQIRELVTGYGAIDIVWLDGGQVRPPKQDIKMDALVAMARARQPDLLVVNRASHGLYEDYTTPEQEVPKEPKLDQPWETCMTIGNSWSFKPDDEYKSTERLVRTLVEVVAKGGNIIYNVGPQPDGRLPAEAVRRMEELGDWMRINGESIYGTRPTAPYRAGDVAYTRRGAVVYAIVLGEPRGRVRLPRLAVPDGARATLLGVSAPLAWSRDGEDTVVELPRLVSKHAHAIRFAA
jgi:alpha-L-fucosidase